MECHSDVFVVNMRSMFELESVFRELKVHFHTYYAFISAIVISVRSITGTIFNPAISHACSFIESVNRM